MIKPQQIHNTDLQINSRIETSAICEIYAIGVADIG